MFDGDDSLIPTIRAGDAEVLGDEIAARAAGMTAALGEWLELVARFDATGAWSHFGALSCAHWLAWRCSLSPVTAREHVRVARRLGELPLIAAALRRGQLSFSKVRALVRFEHIADEEEVLQLARHATASQLERIVRATRRVTRAQAAAAVEDRYIDVDFEDDGTAVIRGRVPAEDGALLLRALAQVDALLQGAAAEERSNGGDAAGFRPAPSSARRADALAWMADHGLAHATAVDAAESRDRTAGERCEVLVHVDARLLAVPTDDDDEHARDSAQPCALDDGAPLAAETARRICCDAGIVPVVRDGDRTLAVGRRTRSIPPAIRRALRVRRPGCGFPGCQRTRWLDAHHIRHWAHGGRTDLDNLVQLCRHHHRLVHEGGWRLALAPDGRHCIADAPDGRRLLEAPESAGARAIRPLHVVGDTDGLMPLSRGERYDLDLAVDALLAWTRAPGDPPCTVERSLAA